MSVALKSVPTNNQRSTKSLNRWQYETAIGYNIAVSIRGDFPISEKEYNMYLEGFINKYKNRITEVRKTSICYPQEKEPEYVTIIKLTGITPVVY